MQRVSRDGAASVDAMVPFHQVDGDVVLLKLPSATGDAVERVSHNVTTAGQSVLKAVTCVSLARLRAHGKLIAKSFVDVCAC